MSSNQDKNAEAEAETFSLDSIYNIVVDAYGHVLIVRGANIVAQFDSNGAMHVAAALRGAGMIAELVERGHTLQQAQAIFTGNEDSRQFHVRTDIVRTNSRKLSLGKDLIS